MQTLLLPPNDHDPRGPDREAIEVRGIARVLCTVADIMKQIQPGGAGQVEEYGMKQQWGSS